jgi:hypothetical protein
VKTWEVKLEAVGAILTETVKADDWDTLGEGISFYTESPDGASRADVAFYPYSRLLGVKDVTP